MRLAAPTPLAYGLWDSCIKNCIFFFSKVQNCACLSSVKCIWASNYTDFCPSILGCCCCLYFCLMLYRSVGFVLWNCSNVDAVVCAASCRVHRANTSALCAPCSAPTTCIEKSCTWPSCTPTWGPHPGAWSLSGAGPVCWRPTFAACRICCPCSTGNGTSSSTSVPPTSPPGQSPSRCCKVTVRARFFRGDALRPNPFQVCRKIHVAFQKPSIKYALRNNTRTFHRPHGQEM